MGSSMTCKQQYCCGDRYNCTGPENPPRQYYEDHRHEWVIWPETDGLEQKCMKCGSYRSTPK